MEMHMAAYSPSIHFETNSLTFSNIFYFQNFFSKLFHYRYNLFYKLHLLIILMHKIGLFSLGHAPPFHIDVLSRKYLNQHYLHTHATAFGY